MYRCQLHKMDGKVFHLIFDNTRPIANWITTSSTRSFSVPLLIWYNTHTHTHMDKRIESSEIQHTLCLNCCIAIFKVRLLYLLFFLFSVCFMSRIVYTSNNYSTIALLIVCFFSNSFWMLLCDRFDKSRISIIVLFLCLYIQFSHFICIQSNIHLLWIAAEFNEPKVVCINSLLFQQVQCVPLCFNNAWC